MNNEIKYLITIEEDGQRWTRTDWGLSDEEMAAHYQWTGLNVISIVRG